MRAVFMNENPMLVKAVIGVAAHMAAALQHQDPPAAPLCHLPGGHRTGVARADDQAVKMCVHQVPAFSEFFHRYVLILSYREREENEKSIKVCLKKTPL